MSHQKPSRRQVLIAGTMAASTGVMFGFSRTASAATDESKWVTQIASWSIQDGKEDDAVELLRELTKAVEEKEPGVLAYMAHRYQDEPNKVVFFEVFDSAETLKSHGAQPHLRTFSQRFGELFKGPFEISKLDKIGGFMRDGQTNEA